MPKYRLLTLEELEALEKEFVDYLVVNGIMADDWVAMKEEQPEEASKIIDLFSDVVFEGIMRKTYFLERRSPKDLHAFQCLPDKIILMGMRAGKHPNADFTKPEFIQQAMQQPPKGLEVYTLEKKYAKQRELEIFDMIQQGCQIADGNLFKSLALIMAG